MNAIGTIMILSVAVPAIAAIVISFFKRDDLFDEDETEPWNWV